MRKITQHYPKGSRRQKGFSGNVEQEKQDHINKKTKNLKDYQIA